MKRRPSIWEELRRMQRQIDSIFRDFDPFGSHQYLLEGPDHGELVASNYREPLTDIYETNKELIAEIEMPGIDKKDIKVHVSDDGIEVRAESHSEIKQEDKKGGMYRLERTYSGFHRYFSLPTNVDPEKATAEYKNGILKITVPKLEPEEHKKRKLLEVK